MRNKIWAVTRDYNFGAELSMTALRVFAGLSLALGHGMKKVPPSSKFIDGVGAMGFPWPEVFAGMAGGVELIGGIFLALGFLTRPSALFIALTMLVAALIRHAADPFGDKELALLYFFISLIFLFRGANSLSVDRIFCQKAL